MDRGEIQAIAKLAAKEAVKEMLVSLGADVENPTELQRDFSHLRKWREAVDSVPRVSLASAITIITGGVLGFIWAVVTGRIW